MPLVSSFSVNGSGQGNVTFNNNAGTGAPVTPAPASTSQAAANAAASAANALPLLSAQNLGIGSGVYAGNTGSHSQPVLNFKTLIAGTNVSFRETANSITINATGSLNGAANFIGLTDAPHSITDNALLFGQTGALHFTPAPTGAHQALIWTGSAYAFTALPSGSVTSVGLSATSDFTVSPSPVTASGNLSIALTPTGVSAGSYGIVSVDTNGRVRAGRALVASDIASALGFVPVRVASVNGQAPDSNGNITVNAVTSVAAASGAGIAVSGGPITSAGTLTIALATSGVAAGSYGTLVVDAYGRLTSVRSLASADVTTALGYTPGRVASINGATPDLSGNVSLALNAGTVTSVAAAPGTGITVAGGPITSSGTLTIGLSNSGVIAGSYANVTVDATGRVVSARALASSDITTAIGYTPGRVASINGLTPDGSGNVALALNPGTVTSVAAVQGDGITVSGGPITSSGTFSIALAASGVVAGSYTQFSIDSYGRVTSARSLTSSDLTSALGYTPSRVASVNGQTPDGAGNIAITTGTGTVTQIAATGSTEIGVSGGPVTNSGTFSFTLLPSGVSAGTYTNVSVDRFGRVVSARALSLGDLTTLIGYTPGKVNTVNGVAADGTGNVTIATGTGTVTSVAAAQGTGIVITGSPITTAGTFTVGLGTSGVTSGVYANLTIDPTGRVTAARALSSSDIVTGLNYVPVKTVNGVQPDGSGALTITTGTGTVTSVATANGPGISVTGGPITSSGTLTVGLIASGVTAGNYANLTIDNYGRTTAARALSSSDITAALGYTPGTVASVTAANGAGIAVSGGPITSSGTLTIALTSTTVTAGSYGQFTVDAYGRLTAARTLSSGDVASALGFSPANVQTVNGVGPDASGNIQISVSGSGNSGTVTSVATANGPGISVTGGPITSAGTLTVGLIASGVSAGTFSNLAVDLYGRLTSARAISSGDVVGALGYTPGVGTVTSVSATPGTGITVVGSPITGSGTLAIGLASTTVTAGTYGNFVVDPTGRLTSARAISSGDVVTALGYTPVSITAEGVANGLATLDGSGKLTSSQLPASVVGAVVYQGVWNASTNSPTLASGTGTKGWYYKVSTAGSTTIDGISQWNIGDTIIYDGTTWDKIDGLANEVIAVNGFTGNVTISTISGNAGTATKLQTARTIALSGDATGSVSFDGSANATIAATLAASGVTPNTYNSVQVNAKGLVIAGSNIAYLTSNQTITVTGDATGSGSNAIALTLADSGVVAGSYSNFAVDSKGRVTYARALSSSDITTALGYTPSNGSGSGTVTSVAATGANGITVTGGPITSAGTLSIALATTGVSAGTYTNATVAVDAYGRVTSISQGSASTGGGAAQQQYQFQVAFDSSGNVSATNTFSGVPAGWSVSRDSGSQITVTHSLSKLPQSIVTFALNSAGTFTMKSPNNTSGTQLFATTPGNLTPSSFTIGGLTATYTNGVNSGYVTIQVLI